MTIFCLVPDHGPESSQHCRATRNETFLLIVCKKVQHWGTLRFVVKYSINSHSHKNLWLWQFQFVTPEESLWGFSLCVFFSFLTEELKKHPEDGAEGCRWLVLVCIYRVMASKWMRQHCVLVLRGYCQERKILSSSSVINSFCMIVKYWHQLLSFALAHWLNSTGIKVWGSPLTL